MSETGFFLKPGPDRKLEDGGTMLRTYQDEKHYSAVTDRAVGRGTTNFLVNFCFF